MTSRSAPRRARAARRSVARLLAAGGLAAAVLAGCGGSGRPAPDWREVPYGALVSGVGDQPEVAAVTAGGPTAAWLLGGTVVDGRGDRHVRIWSAPGPAGPWRVAGMAAVPGLDGPQETIEDLSSGTAGLIAFGYRLSPDEGYPRPSAWVARDGRPSAWDEIHEDREFFGGPDIISFGGMSQGPHGCFVAGTWTDGRGRPVISVWRTTDGRDWTHDYTDPAFEGRPGEVPFASGVADSRSGVLVSGSVETPTASDPGHQEGALWLSADGTRWRRLPLPAGAGSGGPGTTFDAVAAVPGGWLVAGTVGTATGTTGTGTGAASGGGRSVPAVWSVTTAGTVGPPQRLPLGGDGTAGAPVVPTSVDMAGDRVTVAGRSGMRAVIWSAGLSARGVGRMHRVPAPPADVPQLQGVLVAAGPAGAMVVMSGADASVVYESPRSP